MPVIKMIKMRACVPKQWVILRSARWLIPTLGADFVLILFIWNTTLTNETTRPRRTESEVWYAPTYRPAAMLNPQYS